LSVRRSAQGERLAFPTSARDVVVGGFVTEVDHLPAVRNWLNRVW